jgi:hypothetical protein
LREAGTNVNARSNRFVRVILSCALESASSLLPSMNLATAIHRIEQSFQKMNEAYQREVFDEVAIVGFHTGGMQVHHYQGPRRAVFVKEFGDKTVALRKELTEQQSEDGGEFGFTREGEGDRFDAYICLGPDAYLFCNNTSKSMHEVTQDPRWLEAQGNFLNASQYFAADPLKLQ